MIPAISPENLTNLGDSGGRRDLRLRNAAQEFEAQMMKELLKPISSGGLPSEESEDSASSGILGDFAGEALGRALSQRGGFGIASSILHTLSPSMSPGSSPRTPCLSQTEKIEVFTKGN